VDMKLFDEVVDCSAEMFLPRAQWGFWFSRLVLRDMAIAVRNRSWRDARYYVLGNTMRCANFKWYQWMGIYVQRPMPWLRGPALQRYPHLFAEAKIKG